MSHKYKAAPTVYAGFRYASKAEALRAAQLDLLVRGRIIQSWEPQPRFTLGCPENVYVADFRVVELGGAEHIEDVKGFETPAFRRNKRLWRIYGPHDLHVMKRKGRHWAIEVVEGRNA